MSLIQCPFCEHSNPAGAKFCGECGGALHLVPCPGCGAVNQVTSTACYQCRIPLRGQGTGAHDTSVPVELLLESSPAPVVSGRLPMPVPDSLPVAVSASPRRRRSWSIAGAVLVVVFAALGYNSYRQRAVEEPPPQAAGNEAGDRAGAAGVVRRNAAAGVASAAAGAATAPANAVALPPQTPLSVPPLVAPEKPRAARAVAEPQPARAAARPASSSPAARAEKGDGVGPFVPATCTEASAALGLCVPTAAPAALAGRSPPPAQEPKLPQECTQEVAALGLCPPATKQGRE